MKISYWIEKSSFSDVFLIHAPTLNTNLFSILGQRDDTLHQEHLLVPHPHPVPGKPTGGLALLRHGQYSKLKTN
jgi:hypothetical protein